MQRVLYDFYTDIGGRKENEDSLLMVKKLLGKYCFVVADGLGGHGGGKTASSAAADCIKNNWSGELSRQEWTRLLQMGHEKVLSLQTPQCPMKTTLVGLMLSRGRAVWCHAGDSRLYHFQDGKLVFQTRDHSVPQLAVMMGDITPDQIRTHEDRSKVLKALGQTGNFSPECGEGTLEKGSHAFLLCTDGFWEHIWEEEMEKTLAGAKTPEQWLEKMREVASSRMKEGNDNNTAITVFVTI